VNEHRILINNTLKTVEQGCALVMIMSDTAYTTSPAALPKASTVGAHFRHVLEHLQLLSAGLASGHVNYDLRKRDRRIEIDREFAVGLMRNEIKALKALEPANLDAPLTVVHHTCPQSEPHEAMSSGARELMFILSHTNHHWALARLLVELHQDTVPETFGYMPSTVRHMNSITSVEGNS
jgi:hypothetical protein